MNKKSQNKFSAEEKVKILNEGEYRSMSINEVCRRHQISPNTYYLWRKYAQQGMLMGLSGANTKGNAKSRREQELEEENKRLKHTIVEITQENIVLKKKNY